MDALRAWAGEGRSLTLATLVGASGSAPRPIGAKLLIADDGRMAGSVSGGCVEANVADVAVKAMRDLRPRLMHYGIADETAWDVGLTCGGEIDVFVEPVGGERRDLLLSVAAAVTNQIPVATAAIVRGPAQIVGTHLVVRGDETEGSWPLPGGEELAAKLRVALGSVRPRHGARYPGLEDTVDATLFLDVMPAPPRLWIAGADHVAVYLARFASDAGFHPIVIDPRSAFAARDRFGEVELRIDWPDAVLSGEVLGARDYVVVVSNDPKVDDPALLAALAQRPTYVGAIGSRRKQKERLERLRHAGVAEERVRELHAPIGLDLGGNEPAELALSIVSELVAVRRGGSGRKMRELRPIVDAATGSTGRP